jgi:hypothetical protein
MKGTEVAEVRFYGVMYLYLKGVLFFPIKVRNEIERKFVRSLWKDKSRGRTTRFVLLEEPLRASSMFLMKLRFSVDQEPVQRMFVDTETSAEVLCCLWEAQYHKNVAQYQIPNTFFMGTPVPEAPHKLSWGEILTVGRLRERLKTEDSFPKKKGWTPF